MSKAIIYLRYLGIFADDGDLGDAAEALVDAVRKGGNMGWSDTAHLLGDMGV